MYSFGALSPEIRTFGRPSRVLDKQLVRGTDIMFAAHASYLMYRLLSFSPLKK